MIHVLCSGGLGNQMFQYAYYRALVEKGLDVSFDTSFFQHRQVHSGYDLERCFGIQDGNDDVDHFSFIYRCVYFLMAKRKIVRFMNVRMEQPGKYFLIKNVKSHHAILYGYWQSARYFGDECSLKNVFIFRNLSKQSLHLGEKMRAENSVAVHVRRGDYLLVNKYENLCNTNYYQNALCYLRERLSNLKIYIFSDDIKYCRELEFFPPDAVFVDFNDGTSAYEDMFLMSQANSIVLANSTFSWWSGYLGSHDYVLRPAKYLKNWSQKDDYALFPEEWIKIPL